MNTRSTERLPSALLVGATGFVGAHILGHLIETHAVTAVRFGSLPAGGICDWVEAGGALKPSNWIPRSPPSCIVNAAALSAIGACEADPAAARALNTRLPADLAEIAQSLGIRLVHLSTDQVFDGSAAPYTEGSSPTPITVYGETKAAGEQAVLEGCDNAAVVRLNLVYGRARGPRASGFDAMLASAREGRDIPLFTDEFRSPISVVDAAKAICAMASSSHTGLLHLGGPEALSRFDLGEAVLRAHGLEDMARRSSLRDYKGPPRSPNTVFDDTLARRILTSPPRPLRAALQGAFTP